MVQIPIAEAPGPEELLKIIRTGRRSVEIADVEVWKSGSGNR